MKNPSLKLLEEIKGFLRLQTISSGGDRARGSFLIDPWLHDGVFAFHRQFVKISNPFITTLPYRIFRLKWLQSRRNSFMDYRPFAIGLTCPWSFPIFHSNPPTQGEMLETILPTSLSDRFISSTIQNLMDKGNADYDSNG